MESTLKAKILSAVDSMLENSRDDIEGYLEQDHPFSADDERYLRECQEELLKLTKFRKAFCAGVDYDIAILHNMVEWVLDMEDQDDTITG